MKYECLIVEMKDGIAKIILNRPQAMNAFNGTLRRELLTALHDAEAQDDVGVIILSGAGKAFSAGMDLKERAVDPSSGNAIARPDVSVVEAVEALSKPIIAAVNGFCYTGAFELALCCDIIIASENAVFADTHAKFGLVHGWGGSQRLPRIVGPVRAMEIILTSDPVSAAEAERIGLVTRVVPADKLMETAEGIAKKILNNSPSAVKAIKALVRKGMRGDLASGLDMETTFFRARREWQVEKESLSKIKDFAEK